MPNPELQPLGVDFLSQSGIQRANALSASSAPGPGRKKAPGAPGTSTAGQRVGAAAQAQPAGKQFLVMHRHGMNGMNLYCVGTLTITADEVKFEPMRATDGRLGDGFALKRIAIKEAARNRIPINEGNVPFPSFHIKLTTGTNYDFAVVTENGQGLAPDEALLALISAGGQ